MTEFQIKSKVCKYVNNTKQGGFYMPLYLLL